MSIIMDEKRVADYFIISGVNEKPELNTESKQLINSVLPITDITVIFRGLGEQCPIGYTCIETTPGGQVADLNNGNFNSPDIHICYRRGTDKPPLIEIGVLYEDKERILQDIEVVYTTPYGRCASTGNSSPKSGTYITYRRAKTNGPLNQCVVVELCVILNNKSEHPPHAFYSIKKNLNKSIYGMIGSEVFLCYKKTLINPPSLCYTPQIISRFPLQDYLNFPLPDTVPLFCLPTGASIEVWPANVYIPRPVSSTFVLTSDSAQKIYGSNITFYEPFDRSLLSEEQRSRLGFVEDEEEDKKRLETYAIKSICILSRWPFFKCFEKFLLFLHRLVFHASRRSTEYSSLATRSHNAPLEHYISHFLLDVSFPSPERPTVIVQLMPGTDETVTFSRPSSRLPLPHTGASFVDLLLLLGVDNTMNVMLFGLCEQKILLHSLKPWVLTGIAEAISAMLFPFHWQCPYVPLCPLNLHGILNAPLPFIVGIDSRCFDNFSPPGDIICIDLDTCSIFLSEFKRCLNLRILPKRPASILRNSLEKIVQRMKRSDLIWQNQSPQHRSIEIESLRQQLEKVLSLEIQEAFIRFMATILKGFRSYLLPITRAPTVGATDPTSLFDFDGFLMSRDKNYSQFYGLITKTQMFTHYIEERSFLSDKDTSLAFFDDCEEKLSSLDDLFLDRPIKLFDKDGVLFQTDRSVYIPAPEHCALSSSNKMIHGDEQNHVIKFGPLNPALFHRHPRKGSHSSSLSLDSRLQLDNQNEPNNPQSIARRTKQEVKTSLRLAKKSRENSFDWSRYLVSCCYCLWFAVLPSYISYCKSAYSDKNPELVSKQISQILRYAHSILIRMQKLQLNADETCFRILTLLCGRHDHPALAVRVFFEMEKAGIKPGAITYGYYNKALLESKWPDHSIKPTTMLWTKIRNVINGIALFKLRGRQRMERRNMHCSQFDLYKNITSTPNFKLSSLINDASNLQWSKWTSSHNSKTVYKGIKSAATGFVSSLQEIKSSFSIPNSNTPSKLLNSVIYKPNTTRDKLSQWANYFSSQAIKSFDSDSDGSSTGSHDLLRLSNEEDIEPSSANAFEHGYCRDLFETLSKHYSNSNLKEDLVDHLTDHEDEVSNRIAMKIKMTTCSRCDVCQSLLYDEEMMEKWSHHDSNLNTRCMYCQAKIVPSMSIIIEDYRFKEMSRDGKSSPTNVHDNDQLINLNSEPDDSFSNKIRTKPTPEEIVAQDNGIDDSNQISFTVPYLSPIVLRKELESVFESSGDICPTNEQFVDEHPIIYWNLLWYFTRINIPTHLAFISLRSKSILNGKEIPFDWSNCDKVIVKTIWDNEKLHIL